MTESKPQANPTLVEYLSTRRSVPAKEMQAPGPTAEQLQQILALAHRTPDHGKLGPWRFVVIEGEARQRFADRLAERFKQLNADASDAAVNAQRTLVMQTPVTVAVVAAPRPHEKIPQWEQQLAVGAVCMNLLHAANAHGFGAQWLTGWQAYDAEIAQALGAEIDQGDRLAGFFYFGAAAAIPAERVRPALEERVSFF